MLIQVTQHLSVCRRYLTKDTPFSQLPISHVALQTVLPNTMVALQTVLPNTMVALQTVLSNMMVALQIVLQYMTVALQTVLSGRLVHNAVATRYSSQH